VRKRMRCYGIKDSFCSKQQHQRQGFCVAIIVILLGCVFDYVLCSKMIPHKSLFYFKIELVVPYFCLLLSENSLYYTYLLLLRIIFKIM